jgi:hypothetical protein
MNLEFLCQGRVLVPRSYLDSVNNNVNIDYHRIY